MGVLGVGVGQDVGAFQFDADRESLQLIAAPEAGYAGVPGARSVAANWMMSAVAAG